MHLGQVVPRRQQAVQGRPAQHRQEVELHVQAVSDGGDHEQPDGARRVREAEGQGAGEGGARGQLRAPDDNDGQPGRGQVEDGAVRRHVRPDQEEDRTAEELRAGGARRRVHEAAAVAGEVDEHEEAGDAGQAGRVPAADGRGGESQAKNGQLRRRAVLVQGEFQEECAFYLRKPRSL